MTNESKKTIQETKSEFSSNNSDGAKDVFVVPEHDGIKSGHPLSDEDSGLSPENFNSRIKNSIKKSSFSQLRKQVKHKTNIAEGFSIKTKIIGSLSVLTLLIVVLGVIALVSFQQITGISKGITERYAKIAKLTDSIGVKTLRIRDAEKNFRLIGEEEALERISRYIQFIRDTIKELETIGREIEINTGKSSAIDFKRLTDTVNKFESLLSLQVKDLRSLEKNIKEKYIKNTSEIGKRLDASEDVRERMIKRLIQDIWVDLKKEYQEQKQKQSNILDIFKIVSDLEINSLNISDNVQRYISTKNQADIEMVQSYISGFFNIIEQLKRENSFEKVNLQIEDIYKNLTEYFAIFKDSINTFNELKAEEERTTVRLKNQDQQLTGYAEELINISNELADKSWGDISTEGIILNKTANNTQLFLLIMVIGGLTIGLLVLFTVPKPILNTINNLIEATSRLAAGDLTKEVEVISNDELGQLASTFEWMRQNLLSLVERIHRASVQISTTVNEIQAASNQQTSTSNEQASAFNEVTATFSEIARTAGTLAGVSERVSENTVKVTNWISESNKKSGQIIDSMNAINESTKQTSERIKRLNDQMDSINDAVNTISGVADQTTLLSLNAAIEANKAGEMGKGFSVVAGEIRRLSDRSIDSATKIASMIRDIQRATESSVVAMDKTAEEIRGGIGLVHESTNTVSGINDSMVQVRDQVLDISNNIQDYSSSATQVQQSMTDLQDSSKMAAQATRQTLSAAYELSSMATQLAEAVSAFKL